MNIVSVFTVYNFVFKVFLSFCLLHVVWVDSTRISGVSYEAYDDFSGEELLRQEDPKARDASHIGKRRGKMKRSLYERKFVQHLVGPEGKESRKISYDHKISSKKYCGHLTAFRKEFLARPQKTGGHKQGTADRELIIFRSLGEKDEFNAYAVIEPSIKNPSGSKWAVTTVSSLLLLIILLALCLHAPCPFLWKRQRSRLDVISCPNPSVHNRPCGKCIYHSDANTGSRRFSSQFMWTQETHPPAKLNRSKKKITALFKGTEPSAGYRYTPLRNTSKREQQLTYEPEWTSIGAFLNNNNQKTSFCNRSYGSTSQSEKKFVDRYGRRSRDSTELSSELVEYALKLRPKRRQVIELKEFPPGYSKTCLNIDLESDPCVVYDPCLEQVHRIRPRPTSDRLITRSDSDLRKLSRADQSENYDSTSLFDVAKPRKSSLKSLLGKSKSNSKVVHFFPSNLKYDKQFVQIPSQNEIIKTKEDNIQKQYGFSEPIAASKTTHIVSDMQVCLPSRENFSKVSEDKDLQEPPTKLRDTGIITKEHAIDWDLRSPVMETTSNADPFKLSRDRGSSNFNLGFSHSTETVSGSKDMFTLSKDTFSSIRNMSTKQSITKRSEPFSNSYTDLRMSSSCRDLHDIEADYKPEPLAGLLSPKLNANRAGDELTCRTTGYKTLPSNNKDKAFTDCIQQHSQSESAISRDQSHRIYSNIPQDFSHVKWYPVKESCTEKDVYSNVKRNDFQESF